MNIRFRTVAPCLALGLLTFLLGCGGSGGDDGGGGSGSACGSEWNTQAVLAFTGPDGCLPAGREDVYCARYWGVGPSWFIDEIDEPSPR